MSPLWLLALDTARGRGTLRGALARSTERALKQAARLASVRVFDACVLPIGLRAVVEARSVSAVRSFAHRLVALAAGDTLRGHAWRPALRAACGTAQQLGAWRSYLKRCREQVQESYEMPNTTKPAKQRGSVAAARRGSAMLRMIEGAVDAALGVDEFAARIRRYVADHEAPGDDAMAFARLCTIIFAQGLDFGVVAKHRAALDEAFCRFDPAKVAAFDDAAVARLLAAPIIRNEAKITACIENARRWDRLRNGGSYLSRVAEVAASDEAAAGWPGLAEAVRADFVRLGETGARQVLKRWGFFTALAHPGARRVLERLGLVEPEAAISSVQTMIGAIASGAARDPYAVEAALVLFAACGPCRLKPRCDTCVLSERCPTAPKM